MTTSVQVQVRSICKKVPADQQPAEITKLKGANPYDAQEIDQLYGCYVSTKDVDKCLDDIIKPKPKTLEGDRFYLPYIDLSYIPSTTLAPESRPDIQMTAAANSFPLGVEVRGGIQLPTSIADFLKLRLDAGAGYFYRQTGEVVQAEDQSHLREGRFSLGVTPMVLLFPKNDFRVGLGGGVRGLLSYLNSNDRTTKKNCLDRDSLGQCTDHIEEESGGMPIEQFQSVEVSHLAFGLSYFAQLELQYQNLRLGTRIGLDQLFFTHEDVSAPIPLKGAFMDLTLGCTF